MKLVGLPALTCVLSPRRGGEPPCRWCFAGDLHPSRRGFSQRRGNRCPLSLGRVALLGNAQRQSRANYQVNSRYRNQSKTLSMNIKTTGDWLKFKRIAKNLTPSHVAMKMGIATSLVYSLESSLCQPDSQQLKSLAQILEFDVEDLETAIKKKPECAIISCDFKQTADGSAVGYCTANCNGFCWLPEWA